MESQEFILEIGFEEIPWDYLEGAKDQIKENFQRILEENKIWHENLSLYITSRRIVIYIEKISKIKPKTQERIIGPPWKEAFLNNKPTKALLAFLEKNKADLKDIKREEIKNKGIYVVLLRETEAVSVLDILNRQIPQFLNDIWFPKKIRWEGDFKFARPIRWILCMLGNEVVEFKIADVKSMQFSFSNRFLFNNEKIQINSASEYLSKIKQTGIILSKEEREKMIRNQLKDRDFEGNLTELCYLTEYPFVIESKLPDEYKDLPVEVIFAILSQQKTLIELKEKKPIGNFFIITHSNKENYVKNLTEGYKKVIKAKIQDAIFYFKEDKRQKPTQLLEELKNIEFHKKLGNLYQKSQRIKEISKKILQLLGYDSCLIEEAALWCKLDLASHMVGEYPSLAGLMNYYYLKEENPKVAEILKDLSLPIPKTKEAAVVSVADKVDNLYGFFMVGEEATGSYDPYGLRKDAHFLIEILIEKEFDSLSLDRLFEFAKVAYQGYVEASGLRTKRLIEFINARLVYSLKEKDFSDNIIHALSKDYDNPSLCYKKAKVLKENKQLLDNLKSVYKRLFNILKQTTADVDINPSLFLKKEEEDLYNILRQSDIEPKSLQDYLKLLENFILPVGNFFDKVLVMEKDQRIRKNRLALLTAVKRLFDEFADFTRL